MSKTENFNPDSLLSARIGRMSRNDTLDAGLKLCAQLMPFVQAGERHGGVRPDNISVTGREVVLGPPGSRETEPVAAELEYISPEQFRENAVGPSNDVYSLGLVLYAACNDGRLPFLGELGEYSPEDRANGLRRRMLGEVPPPPPRAGEKMGAVILKALSADPKERFADAGEFARELMACPYAEPPAVAEAAPGPAPAAPAEAAATREYKVDKAFEPVSPAAARQRKKNEKPMTGLILALILVVAAVAAIIAIMRGCETDRPDPDITLPSGTPAGGTRPTSSPAVTSTPRPSPGPSASPAPTLNPDDYDRPIDIVRYEVVFADLSWEDAAERCRRMGGHLATPRNESELSELIKEAERVGASLLWIGAFRAPGDVWTFVTGEKMEYFIWGANEPSYTDADGTQENYLLLWNIRIGGETGWRYNDSRPDPAADFPRTYAGKIAFVCEYEIPSV